MGYKSLNVINKTKNKPKNTFPHQNPGNAPKLLLNLASILVENEKARRSWPGFGGCKIPFLYSMEIKENSHFVGEIIMISVIIKLSTKILYQTISSNRTYAHDKSLVLIFLAPHFFDLFL